LIGLLVLASAAGVDAPVAVAQEDAQTVFVERFESGWGNWYADNGVWQIGTPTIGPMGCHGGTQCATTGLTTHYPWRTLTRLISPSIALPDVVGSEELHLRFWHWFAYGDNHSGQVQVSVRDEAAGTWSAWATVGTAVSRTSPLWSPFDVDLTVHAGKTIRLAFYNYTYPYPAAGAPGWYIDDIEILKKVPEFTASFSGGWGDWYADNGVWQIGVPTIGPMGCHAGTQCATTGLTTHYPWRTLSRLVSPPLDLPDVGETDEIHLRFWHWFAYGENHSGHVQISVRDEVAGRWLDWVDVGPPVSNVSLVWTEMDIDLTLYAGQRIRLAFYNYTYPYPAAGAPGWYIDGIEFRLPAYPLSVTKTGPGSGTITSTPAGIDCGTACSASYAAGTSVRLVATPAVGSVFAGWSGACSGLSSTCTVSMDAAKAVTAVFSTTGTASDLVVSVFSVPVTGADCSQVNVTDTTRNSGTGTALPSTTKYFFSVDSTYSAEDELIGSRAVPSLPALAVDTGTATVTLPCLSSRAGSFYVLAVADAGNVVFESKETNNLLGKPIKMGADLVVYAIAAVTTARACSTITLDDTTKNNGVGQADGSTTRCYLSTDSALQAWDVPLDSGRAVAILAPGASDRGARSVTIPCDAAARSYLICAADANGQAVEFNNANNTKAKSITITR
jgi:hypothetical protein